MHPISTGTVLLYLVHADNTSASASGTAAAANSVPNATPSPRVSAFGPLRPVLGAGPLPVPEMSLAGVMATEFFIDCMARGGGLPSLKKGDRSRGKLVLEWFGAFVKPEERILLLPRARGDTTPRDEGSNRRLGAKIHYLVCHKLAHSFIAAGAPVPRDLANTRKKSRYN